MHAVSVTLLVLVPCLSCYRKHYYPRVYLWDFVIDHNEEATLTGYAPESEANILGSPETE